MSIHLGNRIKRKFFLYFFFFLIQESIISVYSIISEDISLNYYYFFYLLKYIIEITFIFGFFIQKSSSSVKEKFIDNQKDRNDFNKWICECSLESLGPNNKFLPGNFQYKFIIFFLIILISFLEVLNYYKIYYSIIKSYLSLILILKLVFRFDFYILIYMIFSLILFKKKVSKNNIIGSIFVLILAVGGFIILIIINGKDSLSFFLNILKYYSIYFLIDIFNIFIKKLLLDLFYVSPFIIVSLNGLFKLIFFILYFLIVLENDKEDLFKYFSGEINLKKIIITLLYAFFYYINAFCLIFTLFYFTPLHFGGIYQTGTQISYIFYFGYYFISQFFNEKSIYTKRDIILYFLYYSIINFFVIFFTLITSEILSFEKNNEDIDDIEESMTEMNINKVVDED